MRGAVLVGTPRGKAWADQHLRRGGGGRLQEGVPDTPSRERASVEDVHPSCGLWPLADLLFLLS